MLVRRELPHRPILPMMPMLRTLMSWDLFREIAPLLGIEGETKERFAPTFAVKETKAAYIFKADLPGVEEKDIEVTVTANRLTVKGNREEEKHEAGDLYYACERSFGTFTRSFTLPDDIDVEHVEAELKRGVLTVVVPKNPELHPRKVSIKGVIDKVRGALEKGAKA